MEQNGPVFAIITIAANDLVSKTHHRMPLILRPEDEASWLDQQTRNRDILVSLMKPYPSSQMAAYPVSRRINRVENDSPDCLEPVDPRERQGLLDLS